MGTPNPGEGSLLCFSSPCLFLDPLSSDLLYDFDFEFSLCLGLDPDALDGDPP